MSVVSATEVYAHIDEDSLQAVRQLEEALITYQKDEPQMLTEPPELDTYVILCTRDVPCR